ncbi:MAG: BREX system P-loop protein BrxC [Lachnospiraceae bacterium]|nr:BREX system P-loop protein BrxC [Lachnospiraceae bacterium]
MKIGSLFVKNPLRYINGVIKADEQTAQKLWPELDEYVITKELDKHFRNFFETYVQSQQSGATGDIGVWISGYFGSGKSHFLKMLSCLLANVTATNEQGQTRSAVEFFREKVTDPALMANIELAGAGDTDAILFNIDSKANTRAGDNAILGVFWQVFNEMQGYYGQEPHIAAMESFLEKRKLYDDFKAKFQEVSGNSWESERSSWMFIGDTITDVLARLPGISRNDAERWVQDEGLSFSMSIESFAQNVSEYLHRKGKNHRIVFLVDEVGQFIGTDTKRMLQLQTITENLGTACGGRAWVIVTSQEDIETILGEFHASKSNDFSKIQGRFRTKLSLSSSNTDEVIQYRLLQKTDEANTALKDFWKLNGDAITSRLMFASEGPTLPSFKNEESFAKNYPFVSYQFLLVQKIFEAIRKAGATGAHLSRGERSMLDAFQSAMKGVTDKEIGSFIPIYAFYDPIEGFLDTTVKATIEKSSDLPGLEAFDNQLLKTLFLIRYVDLIEPTVDNLVPLFFEEWDADRIALKDRLNASLLRLEKETLISRNGSKYYFLTNEERDISQEIKNQAITTTDVQTQLSSFIFDDLINFGHKVRIASFNRDYDYSCYLDGHIHASRTVYELGLEVITQFGEDYSADESNMMMDSARHTDRVRINLAANEELEREIYVCTRTDKYLTSPKGRSDRPTIKRILDDIHNENANRKQRIRMILERLILEAPVYYQGIPIQRISRSSLKSFVNESLEYLVQNVYSRFSLLKNLHPSDKSCMQSVTSLLRQTYPQEGLVTTPDTPLNPALKAVQERVKLSGDLNNSLQSVVDYFKAKPYGWPEWETVYLAVQLYRSGDFSLAIRQDMSPTSEDIEKTILRINSWKEIILRICLKPAEKDVKKANKIYQSIKGNPAGDTPAVIVTVCRALLKEFLKDLTDYKKYGEKYPGSQIITDALELLTRLDGIADDAIFAAEFAKAEDELLDLSEDIDTLRDFFKHQIPVWDHMLTALDRFEHNKLSLEADEEARSSLQKLKEIAQKASPWADVKNIEGYISRINAVLDSQLSKARTDAASHVSQEIRILIGELDKLSASESERSRILEPLQELLQRAQNASTVADAHFLLNSSKIPQRENAYARLNELRKRNTTTSPVADPHKPSDPEVKKTIHISFSELVGTETCLNSPEDIDNLLIALRSKLSAKLNENASIILR